jgi:hypothetical protein
VHCAYTFRDLVTYSGASKNEVTSWVQRGLIRPDVQDTTGTGRHRAFGFHDVLEACIAARLNRIPGGMPLVTISHALDVLRFEAEASASQPTPWGAFLTPASRDPAAQFWLVLSPSEVPRVLDLRARNARLADSPDAQVCLRLDTLLVELEGRADDHAGSESGNAFTKRGTEAAVMAAIAGELELAGMASSQLQHVLRQLQDAVAELTPDQRTTAALERFVALGSALATIRGIDPQARWRRSVVRFLTACSKTRQPPSDDRVLQLLAAREAGRTPENRKAR